MTVRGTLALAVIFAVLTSYLAVTREPSVTPQTDAAPALLAAPVDSVSRVEIGRVAGPDEHDAGWPGGQAADLLATLATLRPLAIVDDAPNDPAIYGLGPDATRLRVLAATKVLLDLELGAPNPAGTGMYVRHSGQHRVLLVGSLLRWEIEKLRRASSATAQP